MICSSSTEKVEPPNFAELPMESQLERKTTVREEELALADALTTFYIAKRLARRKENAQVWREGGRVEGGMDRSVYAYVHTRRK